MGDHDRVCTQTNIEISKHYFMTRLTYGLKCYLGGVTVSFPLASAVFLLGTLDGSGIAETTTKDQFSEARVHSVHIDHIVLVKIIILQHAWSDFGLQVVDCQYYASREKCIGTSRYERPKIIHEGAADLPAFDRV